MIFVTLGSQKFQFNRLLEEIDVLIEKGIIKDQVFAQTGVSDYKIKRYDNIPFLDTDSFHEKVMKSDLVITHGGSGAIVGAVKKGKKVIAVPRLATYGEHVDDHQLQLVKQFEDLGIILACYDVKELGAVYAKVQDMNIREYHSNTEKIIESLEIFLKENIKEK